MRLFPSPSPDPSAMSRILSTVSKIAIPVGAAVSFLQYSMYDGKYSRLTRIEPGLDHTNCSGQRQPDAIVDRCQLPIIRYSHEGGRVHAASSGKTRYNNGLGRPTPAGWTGSLFRPCLPVLILNRILFCKRSIRKQSFPCQQSWPGLSNGSAGRVGERNGCGNNSSKRRFPGFRSRPHPWCLTSPAPVVTCV